MAARILIVEDESSMAQALAYTLGQEGFEVQIAGDGQAALDLIASDPPALVLLDLMLPKLSGWDVFAALRRKSDCPVIMLTARAEEADRVSGLEMGADDYITKPFSMRELVARVRTVLRRFERSGERPESDAIEARGVRLDPERRQVLVDGREVDLSKTEFDLLSYLMRHAGRVRSREDILRAVWGDADYTTDRAVDVHVHWLRRKIEDDPGNPRRLLSVRGVGYKFAEDEGP